MFARAFLREIAAFTACALLVAVAIGAAAVVEAIEQLGDRDGDVGGGGVA